MKPVTPEFLTDVGFLLRLPDPSSLYSDQEYWDLTWDGLRICLTLVKHRLKGYRDAVQFSATANMGDKNYGYTSQVHYETLKAEPQIIIITIYKSLSKFAKAKLQWDMRRLLAIETEQAR